MSSSSISYIKYRAWDNWRTDVSNFSNPYASGYNRSLGGYYGTYNKMNISVSSGYKITGITITVPKMAAQNHSGSTNVYALLYTSDTSSSFTSSSPATPSYSSYTTVSLTGNDTNNIKISITGLDIRNSGYYYVFVTTDATTYIHPFIRGASNISCSLTEEQLPIPATSITLSESTLRMGTPVTISWSPYTAGYTYTAQYTISGQSSITAIYSGTESSCSWTPPTALGNNIPTATSIDITISVFSYRNSTIVGTASKTVTVFLPLTGVEPQCENGWAVVSYETEVTNHCVAGYSTIKVVIDTTKITYKYGARAASSGNIVATCNGNTRSSTGSLGLAIVGENRVTVTVKDSRGYTTTLLQVINGEAYSPPSFSSLSVIRCDSSADESITGTYYAVTPSVSYTSLNGDNSLSVSTSYRELGTEYYTTYTNITNGQKSSALGSEQILTTKSYEVIVKAKDTVNNVISQVRILPNTSVAATFHLNPSGLGAAFFGLSDANNELQVYGNLNIKSAGKLILNNSMYGTSDPPTTGAVAGQIYLKLID